MLTKLAYSIDLLTFILDFLAPIYDLGDLQLLVKNPKKCFQTPRGNALMALIRVSHDLRATLTDANNEFVRALWQSTPISARHPFVIRDTYLPITNLVWWGEVKEFNHYKAVQKKGILHFQYVASDKIQWTPWPTLLVNENQQLQTFMLPRSIDDNYCTEISMALHDHHCIKNLDIQNNNLHFSLVLDCVAWLESFSATGLQWVALQHYLSAFRHNLTPLVTSISFHSCFLTCSGIDLWQFLKTNNTLKLLDLRYSRMTCQDVKLIFSALLSNTTLEQLDLVGIQFPYDAELVSYWITVFYYNRTLRAISIDAKYFCSKELLGNLTLMMETNSRIHFHMFGDADVRLPDCQFNKSRIHMHVIE